MKKTLIPIAVLIIILTGVFVFKQEQHKKYIAQVALAKELNKSMNTMMRDFVQERVENVKDVPTDGQWKRSISFSSQSRGELKYFVRDHQLFRQVSGVESVIAVYMDQVLFRRLQNEPEVLEVQIQSKNVQQLKSNFRIRLKA